MDNKNSTEQKTKDPKDGNDTNDSFTKQFEIPNMPKGDTSFANFLFPNTSRCRETDYICKVTAEKSQNLDRIVYENDLYTANFLDISGVYKK